MFEYSDEPSDHPWNPRVCSELGYAFVHIPKTAGNSIAQALSELQRSESAPRRTMHKHTKARHLRDLLGQAEWDRLHKFTVVRNPWDLMVSSYHWWLHTGPTIPHLQPMAQEVAGLGGFAGFLDSRYGSTMINECSGEMLDWLRVDGKLNVDTVLRYETLASDWRALCSHLGFPWQPLPELNTSEGRKSYWDYYNERTRDLVANRFQEDIALLGYEF